MIKDNNRIHQNHANPIISLVSWDEILANQERKKTNANPIIFSMNIHITISKSQNIFCIQK